MDEAPVEDRSLGLIAGAGALPVEAARLLAREGYDLRAVAFEGLTGPELGVGVRETRWLRLGRLQDMAEALREMAVDRLLLLGKVPKALLFEDEGVAEPDEEALRLLAASRDHGDAALMGAIAGWLEDRGFELCAQDRLLSSMLAPEGTIGARAPSEVERADLAVGLPVATRLGQVGVGQCVVVKQGSVLALEAIEGTDATIRRAGQLGGAGATVIKRAGPDQDRRFDLPAVGVGTIEAIEAARASALAIEAGTTLIVDRASMISAADRAGIAVWGFRPDHGA
ncbi:MAG TPA: LpxI family protein [Deltaproteobacteria bacterium]|nr:LpxI family protein [Deltaproteobacteria bacterium]